VLIGTLRQVSRFTHGINGVSLQYAPSWLAHGFALSEDLPLIPSEQFPLHADSAAGAVDDARPDRWGERVIRFLMRPPRLSLLDFLYFAGDERIGALGVSISNEHYDSFHHESLPVLDDVQQIHNAIRKIEANEPVPAAVQRLVSPGATLGGAKPKALLQMDNSQWVLKFQERHDIVDTGLIEHASLLLAQAAGIEVCESHAIPYQQNDTLQHAIAVKRFDRHNSMRLHCLSAHVALRAAQLDYGYPEMAILMRRIGVATAIQQTAEQLFRRMVFNICIDNTDDHEKNHVFILDNMSMRLSPAFDVLPTLQGLGYQSIKVGRDGSQSTLDNALSEHKAFGLTMNQAHIIVSDVIKTVNRWKDFFANAGVTPRDIELVAQFVDRDFLARQRG
jgi:serine/threonine-protein kinase HipA